MVAVVQAASMWGVNGQPVIVEVHISSGLPSFAVVGQPDATCREARDRVRAALLSSGCSWPQARITVNLAPAGVRKVGASLDLPIALGILCAAGEVPPDRLAGRGFLGELGLDGSLRRFPGVVPLTDAIDAPEIVVPAACAHEAKLVRATSVHSASALVEVVEALRGLSPWPDPPAFRCITGGSSGIDLRDVRGQELARSALEVAAAGGHHLLLSGPPGAGKTMLAKRLPALLPPLTRRQAIEVVRIHSAAALPVADVLPSVGPFRAPHHMASAVALLGGGSAWLRPGELSCAQHGVLFLDEMGEFSPHVLDALRQPLEEGVVRVERAAGTAVYPAQFLLVAATNPCPCGWAGTPVGEGPACQCSPAARDRYARRLSGPLLDRFDLRVRVHRPDPWEVLNGRPGLPTAVVAERVQRARAIASARGIDANASLRDADLDEFAPLDAEGRSLLERHLRRGTLTARGVARVRRVARTIADLEGSDPAASIPSDAVALAVEFRRPVFEQVVAA